MYDIPLRFKLKIRFFKTEKKKLSELNTFILKTMIASSFFSDEGLQSSTVVNRKLKLTY